MKFRSGWTMPFLAAIAAASFMSESALALLDAALDFEQQWRVDDFYGRRDVGNHVVTDNLGNIYVGGYSESIYTLPDGQLDSAQVAKYNSSGTREWITPTYAESGLEHIEGMAIDRENNVFIGGHTYRYAAGAEANLAKVDAAGNNLWERHLGSPDNEFGHDVAVDSLGNAYLVGATWGDLGVGSNGANSEGFIAKYATDGDLVWLKQFEDSMGDNVQSVSIDTGDHVIVAGDRGQQKFLAKYDPLGNLLWSVQPDYTSRASQRAFFYESATDAADNIYVVGALQTPIAGSTRTDMDAFVAKHSANGDLLWMDTIATSDWDYLGSVSVDAQGNVFVAGSIFVLGNRHASDSVWAMYDTTGVRRWFEVDTTEEADGADGIAVGPAGELLVVGNVTRDVNEYAYGDVDMFLIRFAPIPEPNSGVPIVVAASALAAARRRTGAGVKQKWRSRRPNT